jgi:uncharacterized membrane protein (UPF0127 family)
MGHPASTSASPLTVHRARGLWSRLGGLLAHPELRKGEALYLAPCAAVHTFFMVYSIDVVFLDASGRVIKVVDDLAPWRTAKCRGARAVLELRGGQASRYGIAPGTLLDPTFIEG